MEHFFRSNMFSVREDYGEDEGYSMNCVCVYYVCVCVCVYYVCVCVFIVCVCVYCVCVRVCERERQRKRERERERKGSDSIYFMGVVI